MELVKTDPKVSDIRFKKVASDLLMLLEGQHGQPKWFTQRVLSLMMHADSDNLAKLASAFPIEAEVLSTWRSNGTPWLGELCGVELKP